MRLNPTMHPTPAGILSAHRQRRSALALMLALSLLAGCASAPDRHITAAPLMRHGQSFEVTPCAVHPRDCRFRTRLTGPAAVDAWIDVRNSAVHAARRAAGACCGAPRVVRIADWMAGFAAWEVTFACPQASPSASH